MLEAWAVEEGFDRAGVASLEPSEHGAALRRWLDRGDHAGMAYMERRFEVRSDSRRILAGARSALCVAQRYAPPLPSDEVDGDLWPGVARYARGRDYHEVMGERLERLAERVREGFPGAGTRWYVDTGPVLERELAERAGLGVFGKNTNLLHPEDGSWFFVGELFTTLELAPGRSIADLCGSCSRCLEACPTGALPEPYRLDANRCISYWTIEHRGALPERVRPWLEGWVFGCDVCQEVCPVNEAPPPAADPELRPAAARRSLDLVGILELDREAYVELFRGSPMKRARLDGLKRNAAVAMGNRGDRRYVPALGRALSAEAEPVVRRHAAWALGRIGGDAARGRLAAALETESDPEVRREIAAARRRCGG